MCEGVVLGGIVEFVPGGGGGGVEVFIFIQHVLRGIVDFVPGGREGDY